MRHAAVRTADATAIGFSPLPSGDSAAVSFRIAFPNISTPAPPASRIDDVESLRLRAAQAYLTSRGRGQAASGLARHLWEDFYREYDPYIRRVVRSWNMPAADTEDCVQEAWLEIVLKLASLKYDPRRGRLRNWLFMVVRRKMIHHLRRKNRRPVQPLTDPDGEAFSPADDPAAECQRREDRERARRLLAAMRRHVSKVNHEILRLRWLEDLTAAEIAPIVRLAPEQVRYRLARMTKKMRALAE
jgi:RNA polymerase sigma factor (sigma-70 family)